MSSRIRKAGSLQLKVRQVNKHASSQQTFIGGSDKDNIDNDNINKNTRTQEEQDERKKQQH